MKYLGCLVAIVLLCLSPNPSSGQPNSSKDLRKYEDYVEILESRNYEKYIEILGTFFWNDGHPPELTSKVKDYMDGLIKENPKIAEELIGEIAKLNEEILEDDTKHYGNPKLHNYAHRFRIPKPHHYAIQYIHIYNKLNALAAIIAYSPLEDNDALDRLNTDQVKFVERAKVRLTERYQQVFSTAVENNKTAPNSPASKKGGFQHLTLESQGKSGSSPKSSGKSRQIKRKSFSVQYM